MEMLNATRKVPTEVLAFAVAAFMALPAAGQRLTWPNKPIRLIVPYAAGGGPERVIRAIASGLSTRLGQPVVVDYEPGAAGNIGFAKLARSAPDGYSWLIGPETTVTINPAIYKQIGFKVSDVAPVNLVSSLVFVLACHPSTQVKSAHDLIARSKVKTMSFASTGAGSAPHMTMELFMERAKFKMTHIPYRGLGPAVSDLLGGQVNCSFLPVSSVQEHVKAGRLLGIAALTRSRATNLPDVPTLEEQGFENFDASFYIGIFGPRGVPTDVQARFANALEETTRTQDVQEAFEANGNTPEGITGEAARKELQRSSSRWQGVLKRLKIEPE